MLNLDEKKIRKGKPIGLPYQGSKKNTDRRIKENKMKVYVLTADTYEGSWGSFLFGVFSTKEKAEKRASEMKLDCHNISIVKIDDNDERDYLGGYTE